MSLAAVGGSLLVTGHGRDDGIGAMLVLSSLVSMLAGGTLGLVAPHYYQNAAQNFNRDLERKLRLAP